MLRRLSRKSLAGQLMLVLVLSLLLAQAVNLALDELSTGNYDGVNVVCADAESGWVAIWEAASVMP